MYCISHIILDSPNSSIVPTSLYHDGRQISNGISARRLYLMMHCYAALGLRLSNSLQAVIYDCTKCYFEQEDLQLSHFLKFIKCVYLCPAEFVLGNITYIGIFYKHRHETIFLVEDKGYFCLFIFFTT